MDAAAHVAQVTGSAAADGAIMPTDILVCGKQTVYMYITVHGQNGKTRSKDPGPGGCRTEPVPDVVGMGEAV